MNKYSFLFLMTLLILIAGCEKTKYGSTIEQGEGYIDRQIGDNKYEIQVTGNLTTTYYTLENYFHRRAKELCKFKPYDYDLKKETKSHIQDGTFNGYVYIPTQKFELPMITGVITCKK